MRIIVGITGATGTIFGVRTLEVLKEAGVETHLVISKWGARTLLHETSYALDFVKSLASLSYGDADQGAPISSGSFVTDGMSTSARAMGGKIWLPQRMVATPRLR